MSYKISLVIVFTIFSAASIFAQIEREEGIKLYKAGKNKEAAAVLEKAVKQAKTDAELWNTLGLAYFKLESFKKAVKAFENAVEIDEQNAAYHSNLAFAYLQNGKFDKAKAESSKAVTINPKSAAAYYARGAANFYKGDNAETLSDADRAIEADANYSSAFSLKSAALVNIFADRINGGAKMINEIALLQQAKETLETCLKNCRNNSETEIQRKRAETLTVFYDYFNRKRSDTLSLLPTENAPAPPVSTPPDPSVTPLKLLSKPKPAYTDRARQNSIEGTIRIAVLFADSGKVTHALILKGLGGGLDENALRAAYGIKFEPAKKDGKPVSQIRIVEYGFRIG